MRSNEKFFELCSRIADKTIERAKKKLVELGVVPHKELIPYGAEVTLRGVKVRLEYTERGFLFPTGIDRENHILAYDVFPEIFERGGVSPDEVKDW